MIVSKNKSFNEKKFGHHDIKKLYLSVKIFIQFENFNEKKLLGLFDVLTEIITWYGKYPAPKEKQYDKSTKKVTLTHNGAISNLIPNLDLALFHKFRGHLIIEANKKGFLPKPV